MFDLTIPLAIYASNLDYARRLTADLPQDKWAFQPAPNMNHASWVIGHLARTSQVVSSMIHDEPLADPHNWHALLGPVSKPSSDGSIYPEKQTLLDALATSHERVSQKLASGYPALLDQPPKLERLVSRFPTLAHFVFFAMLSHETIHLGQLSAWRRVQGMPAV